MAHIRRKFFDLVVAHQSPIATEAVERIRSLYKIEEQIRGRPAEERRQVRNARARPLFESMRTWLEDSRVSWRLNRKLLPPFAMPSAYGSHFHAISMMAASSSTTSSPNGRFVPSPWDAVTICSPVLTTVDSGRPSFIV